MTLALLHALQLFIVPLKHSIALVTWHLLQVFMGAYADLASLTHFALRFFLHNLHWFRPTPKPSLALATWQQLHVFMCAYADSLGWTDQNITFPEISLSISGDVGVLASTVPPSRSALNDSHAPLTLL